MKGSYFHSNLYISFIFIFILYGFTVDAALTMQDLQTHGDVILGAANSSNTNSRNKSEADEIKFPTPEPTKLTPVPKRTDTSDYKEQSLQKRDTGTSVSTDLPGSSDKIASANKVSPEVISVESGKNRESIRHEKGEELSKLVEPSSSSSSSPSTPSVDGINGNTSMYVPKVCRCLPAGCQSREINSADTPLCMKPTNGSCPWNYDKCGQELVSTDSYVANVQPSTPNSAADFTFAVVAADIAGAFYSLGHDNPLKSRSSWWLAFLLPQGWRFAALDKPEVEVSYNGDDQILPLMDCASVSDILDCHDGGKRISFANIMSLTNWDQELLNQTLSSRLSFHITRGVVTGPKSSSKNSAIGVVLTYITPTNSDDSNSERRLMELSGSISSNTRSISSNKLDFGNDVGIIPLAEMKTPVIAEGKLHSSLIWVEPDKSRMGLSFSTSTIIDQDSTDPKVCINLKSNACSDKGRVPQATFSLDSIASVEYLPGGNPFVNFYNLPGKDTLSVEVVNSTFLCVEKLLPNGSSAIPNWEMKSEFNFQLRVNGVVWNVTTAQNNTSESDDNAIPVLAQIELIDLDSVEGSDCGQIIMKENPNIGRGLSVYSTMSIIFYSLGFVAAVLVTRMNGISFSPATFYNDMTCVCIIVVFVLLITSNGIWVSISTSKNTTTSSYIYYLLNQIADCFAWTMITAVCFHWSSVLNQDIRRIPRVYVLLAFVCTNLIYYGLNIFALLRLSLFYRCTYNEYLLNPKYDMRLCKTDYCPDLQPSQWLHAVTMTCRSVPLSGGYFPISIASDVLTFLAAKVLLILGVHVLRRGSRLLQQSGTLVDDQIVQAMRRSMQTYLVVILAISISLGIGCFMNLFLYIYGTSLNPIVWYVLSIWLPTLVPAGGFLVLQWNPRLHTQHWDSENALKAHYIGREPDNKSGINSDNLIDAVEEDDEYNRISFNRGINTRWQSAVKSVGVDNDIALAVELALPGYVKSNAYFVELYWADVETQIDVASRAKSFDELLSSPSTRKSSINAMLQTSVRQRSWYHRRSHSIALSTAQCATSQWERVGFTETVLATRSGSDHGYGSKALVASFLSMLELPPWSASNLMLRFVVYEVPEYPSSCSPSDAIDVNSSDSRTNASLVHIDERAINARVSGLSMAAPSETKVFCEFTCPANEMLTTNQLTLVARRGSHRSFILGKDVDSNLNSMTSNTKGLDAPELRVKSMTVSTRSLKDKDGVYVTRSFQFAGGDDMVVEDMVESIFTNEIPRQYIELIWNERKEDVGTTKSELRAFEERYKNGVMSELYDNLIDQIQGENDQNVVHAWLEERVNRRAKYLSFLKECLQTCLDRAEAGSNFKPSTEKKNQYLAFLPTNMHMQDMWVGPAADLRSQRSRRISRRVQVYSTVTVGAFAAHCAKFRHGGGLLTMRSKLKQMSPNSRYSKEGKHFDWQIAENRAFDDLLWQVTTRFDICFSQALSTLVASFCGNLEQSLQHPTDKYFLNLIAEIGFLFQVESLLSTQGKENGMLEDFYVTNDALRRVSFVLDVSPPSNLPPSLNLHLRELDLPGVVSVRLEAGTSRGYYTIIVGVRCSSKDLQIIPQSLRLGNQISVTPIMFTQGINEMQTLANKSNGKKACLQHSINQKSVATLAAYVERYGQLAVERPEVVPSNMRMISELLTSLEERIHHASRQVVKSKHPKIIQQGSKLCRLLGAGRVTSCKSAKDRTGMSITLEQVRLLSDYHGLPSDYFIRTVSTMRSNGVRLENAYKNTGKRQYAFNTLQRSLLPEEYRCPEGTYGHGNVS